MTNKRISLATFLFSTPISLVGYIVSEEPFDLALVTLIVMVCAILSWLPNMDDEYIRYERRDRTPQPPINPDRESEPDWLNEIKTLNYEIKPPKHWTYAQKLAFDPCPQQ